MTAGSATVPRFGAAERNIKAEAVALKRERILEAATQMFLRCGYHGCSMEAIAQSLGVTKPFIYYQFRDKRQILAEICGIGARLSLQALDAAEEQEGAPAAVMHRFCRRLAEIVVEHGAYLTVYLRETGNLHPDDRRAIVRLRAEIDERVCGIVRRGVDTGDFRVADVRIAASAITTMISHSFPWQRKIDPPGSDAFAAIMADIALRTLDAGQPVAPNGDTPS